LCGVNHFACNGENIYQVPFDQLVVRLDEAQLQRVPIKCAETVSSFSTWMTRYWVA